VENCFIHTKTNNQRCENEKLCYYGAFYGLNKQNIRSVLKIDYHFSPR